MNLESQVCSLELSKRLRELGVSQKSLFCWDDEIICIDENTSSNKISAFTASELLEILPKQFKEDDSLFELHINFSPKNISYIYYVVENEYVEHETNDENSFCNALAKMLIHLIENNLMEIK